jgi:hypothetical protein
MIPAPDVSLLEEPYESPCWNVSWADLDGPTQWQFGFVLPTLKVNDTIFAKLSIEVPLWIPFVSFAIPTAFLWYLDRRRTQPGNCSICNYNLTGNTSGICPECGTPIAEKRTGKEENPP